MRGIWTITYLLSGYNWKVMKRGAGLDSTRSSVTQPAYCVIVIPYLIGPRHKSSQVPVVEFCSNKQYLKFQKQKGEIIIFLFLWSFNTLKTSISFRKSLNPDSSAKTIHDISILNRCSFKLRKKVWEMTSWLFTCAITVRLVENIQNAKNITKH